MSRSESNSFAAAPIFGLSVTIIGPTRTNPRNSVHTSHSSLSAALISATNRLTALCAWWSGNGVLALVARRQATTELNSANRSPDVKGRLLITVDPSSQTSRTRGQASIITAKSHRARRRWALGPHLRRRGLRRPCKSNEARRLLVLFNPTGRLGTWKRPETFSQIPPEKGKMAARFSAGKAMRS
jgi:hypothetical protein